MGKGNEFLERGSQFLEIEIMHFIAQLLFDQMCRLKYIVQIVVAQYVFSLFHFVSFLTVFYFIKNLYQKKNIKKMA